MNVYHELAAVLDSSDISYSRCTSWKDYLGFAHTAEFYVSPDPDNVESLMHILWSRNIPYVVLEATCNTFFSSKCYLVVIDFANLRGVTEVGDGVFRLYSGEHISKVVHVLKKYDERIAGLKGIPGTIGGAVMSNAGAFGVSIGDFVSKVIALTPEGLVEYSRDQLSWGYRSSIFRQVKDVVIVAIEVEKAGNSVSLERDGDAIVEFRRKHLERSFPNLGSTFGTKNIYGNLIAQSIAFKLWHRIVNSFVSKLFFKIAGIFQVKKLSMPKRYAILFIFRHKYSRVKLKTLASISDKTLNTFCFYKNQSLSFNKERLLEYCSVIRLYAKDFLKEEIKIK